MASGEKVVGKRETRPSGHCSMNRGRRGREEVKAISPRPRTWPEDMADAVVTMVSDAKVPGARELGPRGPQSSWDKDGEKEGKATKLTTVKIEEEGGSWTVDRTAVSELGGSRRVSMRRLRLYEL